MILQAKDIELVVNHLKNGGVIGMPTETVYGLAGDAFNPDAIRKIYQLKKRPFTNPLIVHIHSTKQISNLTKNLSDFQKESLKKLENFWPGPLTIILPKSDQVPDLTTASKNSVAIRIPQHSLALDLLQRCSFPLAAPSANISQAVSPTSAKHVADEFGPKLEYILDGENCQIGLESTVISLINQEPEILRPGAITQEKLEEVLGQPVLPKKVISF